MLSKSNLTLSDREKCVVLAKVARTSYFEGPTGCRVWTGGTTGGRGFIYTGEKQELVYRAVKAIEGDIPANTLVRHLCHNKRCCESSHLAVGSALENSKDQSDLVRREMQSSVLLAVGRVASGYSRTAALHSIDLPATPFWMEVLNEALG